MNAGKKYFVTAGFLMLAFGLFFVSNVSATGAKNYQLVALELSQKIKADLSDDSATVQLKKVEEYKISQNEIGLAGDAVCVTGETQMPLRFDVKIATPKQIVSEINYNFVEDTADYAPTSDEEFLMKELMAKISRDYKTTNIVIAIDNYENVGVVNNEKKLLGVGEVRIGGMIWNDIKFDVSLDAATNKAKRISYKLEK